MHKSSKSCSLGTYANTHPLSSPHCRSLFRCIGPLKQIFFQAAASEVVQATVASHISAICAGALTDYDEIVATAMPSTATAAPSTTISGSAIPGGTHQATDVTNVTASTGEAGNICYRSGDIGDGTGRSVGGDGRGCSGDNGHVGGGGDGSPELRATRTAVVGAGEAWDGDKNAKNGSVGGGVGKWRLSSPQKEEGGGDHDIGDRLDDRNQQHKEIFFNVGEKDDDDDFALKGDGDGWWTMDTEEGTTTEEDRYREEENNTEVSMGPLRRSRGRRGEKWRSLREKEAPFLQLLVRSQVGGGRGGDEVWTEYGSIPPAILVIVANS